MIKTKCMYLSCEPLSPPDFLALLNIFERDLFKHLEVQSETF